MPWFHSGGKVHASRTRCSTPHRRKCSTTRGVCPIAPARTNVASERGRPRRPGRPRAASSIAVATPDRPGARPPARQTSGRRRPGTGRYGRRAHPSATARSWLTPVRPTRARARARTGWRGSADRDCPRSVSASYSVRNSPRAWRIGTTPSTNSVELVRGAEGQVDPVERPAPRTTARSCPRPCSGSPTNGDRRNSLTPGPPGAG